MRFTTKRLHSTHPLTLLMAVTSLVSSVVVCASLPTSAIADDYAPQLGAQHINFTLPTIDDGRPVSLEQFRGKKVLLIQFASW